MSARLSRGVHGAGGGPTTIAAPWAVDANGDDVPTRYLTAGATLIQVVDFDSSTAFPVVADPKYPHTLWNQTLYSNKEETAVVSLGTMSGSSVAGFFELQGKVISVILVGYGTAFGAHFIDGECGKRVMYGGYPAPVPQPYSGAEAGGYCK